MDAVKFAEELRKYWSFDDGQVHTHSWHSREDFIKDKLPGLLSSAQSPLTTTEASIILTASIFIRKGCRADPAFADKVESVLKRSNP